ncbi:LysM peptidoglycan-binding domain-containing protein [Psychrobacillus sp. PGGUH221]|uniref:LysM peptidoglycan-binding domain-containing protein n=1 Tax=Psychrobacillus sp. PGGUH221 TaxID=3020058 RepID=UPI0035C68C2C
MNQDDYQKKIDEHRQSIGLEDNITESRRTRRSSYTKKPKKKSKNLLLPSLFFIFILIPVCIFLYVHFFYTPEVEEASSQGVIQVETKPISNGTEQEEKEESVEENSQEAEDENEPSTPKEETTEQATPEAKPEVKPEVKTEPKEEEPKEEEPKEEEPKEEEQKVETEQRTHIVKADETLYRIAVNYYKDPNAVEKIKAANGLTSNSISAGQKLILP